MYSLHAMGGHTQDNSYRHSGSKWGEMEGKKESLIKAIPKAS